MEKDGCKRMENNDSGITKSKRSRSPYHKKCIPPFVDSSQIDKHLVSKLDRPELEDRYIVLTDENLSLKRLLNEHQKKIQRLCTQLQRQEVKDKKEGRNTTNIWSENQMNVLYQQNRVLQAKVNVLTQQLQSHSRMHARVHRSHLSKGKCTPVSSPNRDEPALLEKYAVKSLPATGEDMKHFQYLQQDFGVDNEEMEREYAECALNENDGGNELEKVMDNVEMIRLRRCNKRQAAHIAAISDHLECTEKELQKLRKIVEKSSQETEQLTKQLQRERQKLREIQGSAVQSSTQAQAIKDLEEQIRDLQNEKKNLKDYNQKLLELTQKNGSDEATKSKADEYKKETVKLKEDNYKLQKKLQDSLSEIGESKKNQVSASDVSDLKLKEELLKQTRECEELKKHLASTVMRTDDLRIQTDYRIAEYRERVLELENEKKRLCEKLNEAQNKNVNVEKQVTNVDAIALLPEKNVGTPIQTDEYKIQEVKNKIVTLQNKLDESVKHNTALKEENKVLADEYKKETVKLKEDNYKLQKKLQDALSEIGESKKNQVSASDVSDLKLKEELLKQTRECEELKKQLASTVMRTEDLRIQTDYRIAEYREMVLGLENEKKRLCEKLNEAQNKNVNVEKQVTNVEAADDRRDIDSSKSTSSENKRGEMDADDVALVVIFLKEMNTELERCYNIISCQHEINKHLLVTIESFLVGENVSVPRISDTLHTTISKETSVNLHVHDIKNKIEREEFCSSKKLFIAELKPPDLLEKHVFLISQQLHKIQLICQVIKPVMLQAIEVIQEPSKLQYRSCKRKEIAKECKCKPAFIESTTLATAEPVLTICQFEIYISKVIFDRNSLNYLEINIQKNPEVSLAWCFLGLYTSTSVRKARKACFESSTVYCGPLTKDVMEYLEQNPVDIVCNVTENYNQSTAVAKGQINVIEAFQNPGNTFKTSTMLTGDNVCGELFYCLCLHCDGENIETQQSVIREQDVQESYLAHTNFGNWQHWRT